MTPSFISLARKARHLLMRLRPVCDIRQWMRNNMLALNDGKTEIIHFSSKFSASSTSPCNVQIGGVDITPSGTARNLGVTFDDSCAMSTHVTNICRSASFAIWKCAKIRNILNETSAIKLIHAFVTSRLDYCNSLLFGLPLHQIRKLQLLQNSAARLITRTKKRDHITPILRELHWLPIQLRIEFKINCFTFKIIHGMAPNYLAELLTIRSSGRTLRSNVRNLHQPIGNTKFYGDRAFHICAPRLWNALPPSIRVLDNFQTFKTHLKAFLFAGFFN